MNVAKYAIATGALLLGASSVAACGGGSTGVEVSGVWARTSPMMSSAGAVYFDLSSEDGDSLIGVSIDPSIAGKSELHETTMADEAMEHDDEAMEGMDHDDMDDEAMEGMDHDDMDDGAMEGMDHEDMAGTMMMVAVETVVIPGGEMVSFEPGGFHVMLLDLVDPLEEGQEFDLTLIFETAGEQVVTVKVQDSATS